MIKKKTHLTLKKDKQPSNEYKSHSRSIHSNLDLIKTRLNHDSKDTGAIINRKGRQKDVLVDVDDLSVNYSTPNGILRAVKDISFKVRRNTITSIVGETGSGKSTTASAIIGLLNHDTGNVTINDYIIPASPRYRTKRFQKYLAKTMQYVFQDPFTSMNPKSRVEQILREPLRVNNPLDDVRMEELVKTLDAINFELIKLVEQYSKGFKSDLRKKVSQLNKDRDKFVKVIIPQYEIDAYKVKNAIAEIKQVHDSITTRLETFIEKKQQLEKIVLKEQGEEAANQLIQKHNQEFVEYRKQLFENAKIEVDALKKILRGQKEKLRKDKQRIKDFKKRSRREKKEINNEFLKILPLLKAKNKKVKMSIFKPRYRSMIYDNIEHLSKLKLTLKKIGEFFPNAIIDALEYQIYVASLSKIARYDLKTAKKIASLLNEFYAKYSRTASRHATTRMIQDKLRKVGLASEDIARYPGDFSGGQKQRIAIARAMMNNPELIIADEPISSLDVSIQAQITNLIKDLKDQNNLTVIFIAHDLRMVEFLSDNIIVMSKGQIVEEGTTKEIFEKPTHPYTRALFSAIPSIDTIQKKIDVLDYDFEVYQDLQLDLKDFQLTPTHRVLSTDEWIDDWKREADKFTVYEKELI